MKKYIVVCAVFLGMATAVSAQEQYTYINQTLRARSWGDYPIVLSNEIKGGIHLVNSVAEANAIPSERKQLGMLCVVDTIDWSSPADNTILMWDGVNWQQVNYMRVWQASTAYHDGEAVFYTGKIYVASQEVGAAVSDPATATDYWLDLQTMLNRDYSLADLTNIGSDTTIAGNILVADGDSWESVAVSGDISISAAGNAQIAPDSVTSTEILDSTIIGEDIARDAVELGLQTTGNYVAAIDAGNGLTGTSLTGEGVTPVINVIGGAGIKANADDIEVDAGDGLDTDAGLLRITPGTSEQILATNTAGTAVEWITVNLNSNNVTYVTSGVTLNDEQQGVVLCSGTFTVTLPSAPEDGTMYKIKNVGIGSITINGNTANIDGFSSTSLVEQYASVSMVYYNGEWFITAKQAQKSVYLGNPTQTGSWRITVVDATYELRFEQYNGSTWEYKLEIED